MDYKKIIGNMSATKLADFYRLCVKRKTMLEYRDRLSELNHCIDLIKKCWENVDKNDIKQSSGPVNPGLMAVMGYHVGDTEGVNHYYRRLIIQDVLIGALPLVGNKRYMDYWGADNSDERFAAMKNWLNFRANDPKHKNHHRALDEWKSDLSWLLKQYDLYGDNFGGYNPND
mgnify:CR=1 FL=1